jgi:hypothetical protein
MQSDHANIALQSFKEEVPAAAWTKNTSQDGQVELQV